MAKRKQQPPMMMTEPESVRRKLAAAYRKRAADPKLSDEDRAEFARMADMWAATLPDKPNEKK